jgi:hypothetical protein
MAWLTSFKLGRPGYEVEFNVNPLAIQIGDQQISAVRRNISGGLRKAVLRTSAPTIRINSNYLDMIQRNQLSSLLMVTDSFLSFIPRDDFWVLHEKNYSLSSTTVQIQENSATKLSALVSGNIQIQYVRFYPIEGEQDYYAGGSYDNATRIVTCGSSISGPGYAMYVSYIFSGWLVSMERFDHSGQAGWMDRFTYDITLTGV